MSYPDYRMVLSLISLANLYDSRSVVSFLVDWLVGRLVLIFPPGVWMDLSGSFMHARQATYITAPYPAFQCYYTATTHSNGNVYTDLEKLLKSTRFIKKERCEN